MKNPQSTDDPKGVRVSGGQQLLFPTTPRALCDEIGLNWWAALKLRDDGWISFDPESGCPLDDGMEEELRFVGSLVVAGCDPAMLGRLLRDLERPYRYRGGRIYYVWAERCWRLLPERKEAESVCYGWVNQLKEQGDAKNLRALAEAVHDALTELGVAETDGGAE